MSRTKLEEIIESSDVAEFSQFFRLKARAEGNFRPSDERLSQYGDADFFDFVKIGQIEFSESQRLLVASAKVGRDLNERSGKKAQYEKAKKILRELLVYSAGIFIFYDKVGSFRFSLVYPEAVGTKREWSNFRRFTYLVSRELTNKTFLQRVGNGDFSTLEKIKDAFSVEKVTKEFYLEYRKLFDGLMEDLSKNHTFLNEAAKNNINTENFAKKLLGQIVFLYFVQKKGWIGVPAGKGWGEGDKNFMGNIYKEAIAKKANFYNDCLEKLFYNALNNAHRDSADPSFSKDFNSRIPFLNGGLFEAEYDWKNSLMYLDNKIFQSIFDVFERYNFTVEEESPDDKEIAVDPEMLGKVFENLLPENLRKGKGTYYTPREIVYYMCRESLVNYLVSNHSNITEENIRNYIFYSESFENFKKQKGESFTPGQWKELDDLLANIRVCDPACGSGAFLVGMLNMIVKLRIFLQTTPDYHLIQQKKEYELKREAIQNCIYGVDIDPGAIEIAKLRLWLALVVDYDLEDIEPLPNLDYRLMCGNSLLEEFEGIKFYNGEKETQASLLTDPEKEKKIEALRKKVKEYFSIHDDKEKLKKRKEINDIKDWLIGTALERRHRDITALHKNEQAKADMLDEKSRHKYLAGFSKWLGSSSNIQKALESLHNPKKEKPFFIWKLEFIDVFEEKGGFDVVIANPPYVSVKEISEEAKNNFSRVFITGKGRFNLFTLFLEKSQKLLKEDGVLTFILPEGLYSNVEYIYIRNYLLKKTTILFISLFSKRVFDAAVDTSIISVKNRKYTEGEFPVFRDLSQILTHLNQNSFKKLPFSLFCVNVDSNSKKIIEKILNGFPDKIENILEVQQGIIYSGQKKEKVFSNEKINDNYKKVLDGRDALKWLINWKNKFDNKYILYSDKLHRPREERLFLADEKLVFPRKSTKVSGAYDDEQYYCLNTAYVCLAKNKKFNLKFVLAILNSKLINYFYSKLFFGWQVTIPALSCISLPYKDQDLIIKIVDKILTITKDDDYLENTTKQAKIRDYEKQIDQLVYKLYALTSEEIKIVEGDK